jgi:hypothetical protein
MPQWSTAHLMFCEGSHDAAFLSHLLRRELSFRQEPLKLSELPNPLADVLKTGFQRRASEDLRLDLAKKFFLPDYVLARDTTLVLVFSYGGSNRKDSMLPFLDAMFTLLAVTSFSSLGQTAERPAYTYALFADADVRGESSTRRMIGNEFVRVGDADWLCNPWVPIQTTKGAFQTTVFGPTAAYVWRKSNEDGGTLEDLVLECKEGEAGLQKTLGYLDSRFEWSTPAGADAEQVCKRDADRLKAAFCVEGQRRKPGGSLAVILGQSDLLGTQDLRRSAAVQDCLAFLNEWLRPVPPAPLASDTAI